MDFPMWNIGGGIKHCINLQNKFIEHKQFLDTNHKLFNYVYDSIFGLRWNGGRVCDPRNTLPMSELILAIKKYNQLGVGFNWSFTNLLLKEEDLNDDYCNLVLEQTNSHLNGVILTSDILRNHIQKNYPHMRIIYSVCNGLKTIDQYKEALDKNDIVVLHPDFNHDYEFLDKLPEKHRIEVMVNDLCSYGCPFRKIHYEELSAYSLAQSTNPIIHTPQELDYSPDHSGCMAIKAGYNKDGRNKLTLYDVDNLVDMGFVHFKLIGREHEWEYYWKEDLEPHLEKNFLRKIIREVNLNHHI